MTISARKNILSIPELVKLILSFQKPCDGANLARTSRQAFQIVMPILWERVEGLTRLLSSFPALNNIKKDKRAESILTQSDFERFNVYAPWVKHLELSENQELSLGNDQLDALCAYSSKNTLLPNLQSLTWTDANDNMDVSWVTLFISPSLLSLEFATSKFFESPRSLYMNEWPLLLHCLSEKSLKLRTLSIFHEQDESDDLDPRAEFHLSDTSKDKISGQLELGLGAFFTDMRPLVNLSTCDEILNDELFTIISAWPTLESLTIRMDQEGEYTLPTLRDTAFPALKSLTLYWIPNFDAFRMFWDTPALVSKLTKVKLLPSAELCYYTNSEFSDTFAQLLPILAEKSPRLEDLWLRVLNPDAARPFYDVEISALDVLHKLPLRALHVEGIYFEGLRSYEYDGLNKQGDLDLVKYFATASPNIEEIGFPLHRVPLIVLQEFHSKIPQLQSLRFDFDIHNFSPGLKVDMKDVQRYRNSPSFTLEANFLGVCEDGFEAEINNFSYDTATMFTNYLFSLWPNVQITAQAEDDEYGENRTVHHKMIKLINEQLEALACCNRDASINYKDVKVLNENSWAQCSK